MTSYRKNLVLVLLLVASTAIVQLEAKTVFRRTDKISENFKQLDLPPEEIDPNVAPPESEPPKVEDVVDAAVPVIDESANEITSADVESTNAAAAVPEVATAAVPAPAAAAAVETPVAEAAPEAAATAAAVTKPPKVPSTTAKPENPISKYCKCSESQCDCCRKFGLPLLTSQGCARIAYLGNDEMNVSLKYGGLTLASRRISSKRARPICVGLPGGYSQFCGRVYGLSRSKESKDFKACLAFELRSDEEVEASLRVSCFKFGPEGLRVAEAEPLPVKPASSDDDDDDDDDIFGFAAGGDDDEDEDDDYDSESDNDADADTDDDDDTEDYAEDDDAEAPEDADYGGFSLAGLLDELDDDEDEKPAKKPAAAAAAAAADQTREHVSTDGQVETQLAQSKDEAGAPAASVPAKDEAASAAAAADEAALPAAVEGEVTSAPGTADLDSTTPKAKKSKKAKKNKKKKAAAEATEETGFAYELLNGILDFFN
ncbi:enolase-phosphatase E1 [Drosophila kikkawai]|uniref:Uncharacterized protein LOC108079453 n=1 Tax=Drosophila kikkawai TaxID=30033 RepID=A0A6P4ILH8_DROKI|nr:uncharacterized protein LOC108079453 [Drosophila kikkawai]XP_017029278.1 uncharacterized protein LOC108079453 [Drosophila kikkawai]XP_017029279.1 uncharacterized protein LOC108079453 [Drosophila kikkawai]XP_017029280.1 uncharacterized protein LOC108079453 [Drosophila kikkawai]KAH8343388.1 hypothetical protein KR059_009694 [Drosophila kikkawai]